MNGPVPVPRLRVGSSWADRPRRPLKFLLSDSLLPVKFDTNRRHFCLLSKYRPVVSFLKPPSLWDWAAHRARQRFENPESRERYELPVIDAPVDASKLHGHDPPKLRRRSVGPGWPNLLTARRALARQQPHRQIANQEMYASLSKPPPPDVLGSDWKSRHKRAHTQILGRGGSKIAQRPEEHVPLVRESATVPSLRIPEASIAKVRHNSGTKTPALARYRSAHVVSYMSEEKPVVQDNLAPDWKEKHKQRQEKILHHMEEKEKFAQSEGSTRASSARLTATELSVSERDLYRSTDRRSVTLDENAREFPVPVLSSPKVPAKAHVNPVGDEQRQFAEAELGLLKDWLRTQIPSHVLDGNTKFVSDLRFQIDQLAFKYGEMKVFTQNMERRTTTKLGAQMTKLVTDLKSEVMEAMQTMRTQPEEQKVLAARTCRKPSGTVMSARSQRPSVEIAKSDYAIGTDRIETGDKETSCDLKFWVPESAKASLAVQTDRYPEDSVPTVLKVLPVGPARDSLASLTSHLQISCTVSPRAKQAGSASTPERLRIPCSVPDTTVTTSSSDTSRTFSRPAPSRTSVKTKRKDARSKRVIDSQGSFFREDEHERVHRRAQSGRSVGAGDLEENYSEKGSSQDVCPLCVKRIRLQAAGRQSVDFSQQANLPALRNPAKDFSHQTDRVSFMKSISEVAQQTDRLLQARRYANSAQQTDRNTPSVGRASEPSLPSDKWEKPQPNYHRTRRRDVPVSDLLHTLVLALHRASRRLQSSREKNQALCDIIEQGNFKMRSLVECLRTKDSCGSDRLSRTQSPRAEC